MGDAVVQTHALEQDAFFIGAERAQHPHRVLALQTKTRVHQIVGQFAGVGEQKQALGIEVQAPHGLPFALVQLGQTAKNRGPVLRIIMGHHLTYRLVVGDHAGGRGVDTKADGLAIDLDMVAKLDALADVRRLVVDRNAALHDELLHLQA